MEIKEFYSITALVAIISLAMGVLMYLMSRMRNDKYDLELKKMQLDVMRQSLESKSYEANEALMSDPKRWQSINHLLIEANRTIDKSSGAKRTAKIDASFFEASGIDLENIHENKKRVFVLTPFHPNYDKTYQTIKNTCSRIGLECSRGDEEFKPGAVLSHILELIAQAGIIIVNIDGRNANVYYELGICHALGKKTILVSSDIDSLPFDIKSQRIVLYKTVSELENNLMVFLARSVVEG